MAHQVKVLATKPGNLNSIPKTHTVDIKDYQKLSPDHHISTPWHTPTHKHTNKCINKGGNKSALLAISLTLDQKKPTDIILSQFLWHLKITFTVITLNSC